MYFAALAPGVSVAGTMNSVRTITPSVTLPSRIAAERLRPLVEMTFKSTFSSSATLWIVAAMRSDSTNIGSSLAPWIPFDTRFEPKLNGLAERFSRPFHRLGLSHDVDSRTPSDPRPTVSAEPRPEPDAVAGNPRLHMLGA